MRDLSKYYLEIEKERGKATAEAVEHLYSLYTDGIYKWLAGIWDKDIGGFYFSRSAKDNEYVEYKGERLLLLPDIESTSQAFGALVELFMEIVFSPFGYRIVTRWKAESVGQEYIDTYGTGLLRPNVK